MIGLSSLSNAISQSKMISWKYVYDLYAKPASTAADIAKMSPLKRASTKWPVVNPVAFA